MEVTARLTTLVGSQDSITFLQESARPTDSAVLKDGGEEEKEETGLGKL